MDIECDAFGVLLDPAERMQQVMLGLYDLMDEAGQANFSHDLPSFVGQSPAVRCNAPKPPCERA